MSSNRPPVFPRSKCGHCSAKMLLQSNEAENTFLGFVAESYVGQALAANGAISLNTRC